MLARPECAKRHGEFFNCSTKAKNLQFEFYHALRLQMGGSIALQIRGAGKCRLESLDYIRGRE